MQAYLEESRMRTSHNNKRMAHTQRFLIIISLALLWCIVMPNSSYAEAKAQTLTHEKKRTVFYTDARWGKKASHQTGLYSIQNRSVANGVCLNLNAIYYYGDIDMLDQAFVHGFQPQNLSIGGGIHFGYLMPLGRFCNWRFTLGAGYLHGNDSSRYTVQDAIKIPAGKGKFNSVFGEANVGVEFYPFPRAGFYLYAGLSLAVSYITYDFYKTSIPAGNTVSVLPMLPLEIGYNFYLGRSVFLGISVAVHQGLMDVGHANLDAWPINKSSRFQWGDGYFHIGLSLSYRWHNCEVCRIAKW